MYYIIIRRKHGTGVCRIAAGMYLRKTSDQVSGTAASGGSAKISPATRATVPSADSQTVKQSLPPPQARSPAVPLPVSAPIAGVGLSADKLSASVVAFARYFSLPLKPELLAAIRRQALVSPALKTQSSPQPSHTPQSDLAKGAVQAEAQTEAKTAVKTVGEREAGRRDALSLAATAAESKGVKLDAGGLEAYAAAIDPDRRERDSGGQGERERRDENPDEAEKDGSRNAPAGDKAPLSGSGLRETVCEFAEEDPLLAVLNRLPGKDGRRWIVFPFTYSDCGREFSVSMRVLLEGDTPGTSRACRMVLDIAEAAFAGTEAAACIPTASENGESGKRRIFVTEPANGVNPALAVYLQPRRSQDENSPPATPQTAPQAVPQAASQTLEIFIRELSRHTGISPDCITVKNSGENFPCERGYDGPENKLLRSVNEVV